MTTDTRYDERPAALIIANPGGTGAADAERAVTLGGGRVMATVALAGAAERLALQPGSPLVLIEGGGVPAADLATVFAAVRDRQFEDQVIATVDAEAIDHAANVLRFPRAALQCAPSMSERVALFATKAFGATPHRLFDRNAERNAARLMQLSDAVTRIAATLARLGVEDEQLASLPASPAAMAPFDDEPPSAADIRAAIRGRRLRAQFFEASLFADPAWDMLLDLYASALEGKPVSVSSLCIAAAVPSTTALRWIGSMTEAGLLERRGDDADKRRMFVMLSEAAHAAMTSYIAAARRGDVPIA